jgi:hypothetical protein
MSITVKNLRPGVLILADAGLRLGPGETVEIAALTQQIQKALAAGLMAQMEADAPQPEASAPAAENGEPDAASRRGGQGGKRPPLETLRRKVEEKAEETAGGAA